MRVALGTFNMPLLAEHALKMQVHIAASAATRADGAVGEPLGDPHVLYVLAEGLA